MFHPFAISKCVAVPDSFEYTPSLIKNLVCQKKFPTAIRIPHNSYVKNGRVIIGHAHGISRSARHITINDTEVSQWFSSYWNHVGTVKTGSLTGAKKKFP